MTLLFVSEEILREIVSPTGFLVLLTSVNHFQWVADLYGYYVAMTVVPFVRFTLEAASKFFPVAEWITRYFRILSFGMATPPMLAILVGNLVK